MYNDHARKDQIERPRRRKPSPAQVSKMQARVEELAAQARPFSVNGETFNTYGEAWMRARAIRAQMKIGIREQGPVVILDTVTGEEVTG